MSIDQLNQGYLDLLSKDLSIEKHGLAPSRAALRPITTKPTHSPVTVKRQVSRGAYLLLLIT